MTLTRLAPLRPSPTVPIQPRAIGAVELSAGVARGASQIADLRQSGSLKLLFPRPAGATLDAVMLNTAGGLTGGDRMQVRVGADFGARICMTSQAAERAYCATSPSEAQVAVRLAVAAEARIDWLPQETILYDGAALARRLTLELHPGGRALLVEPVIFGRAAMGEVLRDVLLRDRWEVWQGGQLVFADALRLSGGIADQMARAAVGGGAGAMASVLYAGPDAGGLLTGLRGLLPRGAGASVIRDGILFARILAPDGFELRKVLTQVIEYLSAAPLPKVWRL